MSKAELLTDEQWSILEPLIPEPVRRADGRGRPWRANREVLNGILWILRTGVNGSLKVTHLGFVSASWN
jgi:transposase